MIPLELERCFDIAEALEILLHDFHANASARFSHETHARQLLLDLAADENDHLEALKKARKSAAVQEGGRINALEMRLRLEELRQRSASQAKKPYTELNTLFERVYECETSELNTIFEYLASGMMVDPAGTAPFRRMIQDHVQRVTDFGKCFDAKARHRITAHPVPPDRGTSSPPSRLCGRPRGAGASGPGAATSCADRRGA